jgi:hypothetical protein
MKYYYVAPVNESNRVAEEGIRADGKGVIRIIVLKDSFIMDKFVLDVYANEIMGLEEYSYFEILFNGISGQLIDSISDNLFAEFFQILIQPLIKPEFLKRPTTDRYEGMGLDVGIHLVENKEKFDDDYKKKILSYYHEID